MDSLSFSFLLFAAYCLALVFVLPPAKRARQHRQLFDPLLKTSWPVVGLTVALFTFFYDVVNDPVALQGERQFLENIYRYAEEGTYFGVPLTNFAGWGVVVFLSLLSYCWLERSLQASESVPREVVKRDLLLGIGLYYSILALSLNMTFWIGEMLMGIVSAFVNFPLTAVLLNTLWQGLSWSGVDEPLRGRTSSQKGLSYH